MGLLEVCHCAKCGEKFYSPWTDDEAAAEYEETFNKPLRPGEAVVLCDTCYKEAIKLFKAGAFLE